MSKAEMKIEPEAPLSEEEKEELNKAIEFIHDEDNREIIEEAIEEWKNGGDSNE